MTAIDRDRSDEWLSLLGKRCQLQILGRKETIESADFEKEKSTKRLDSTFQLRCDNVSASFRIPCCRKLGQCDSTLVSTNMKTVTCKVDHPSEFCIPFQSRSFPPSETTHDWGCDLVNFLGTTPISLRSDNLSQIRKVPRENCEGPTDRKYSRQAEIVHVFINLAP